MVKKSFTFFLFLIFSIIITSTIFADFEISKWPWFKEIRLTAGSTSKLASFTVDNEVFENAKERLADLRIIDDSGREIAYKLTVETSKQATQSFGVTISNLGSVPGQYTQLILDLNKDGILHNAITLATTSRDFRRQVEVETSSDSRNWLVVKKASEGAHIYDYSLDFKAQNTTINYPESTYRYLRLKIIDNGEDPLKIIGANAFYNVSFGARQVTHSPRVMDRGENKELRSNFYILDLEVKGIPSSEIRFSTKEVNFNREVMIEGSNDKSIWNNLSRDVIFVYQTPKFNGDKKTINYSESNYRYLRLTVFNRDNQPISLSDFVVVGTLRKVLFETEPNHSYNLYYGNSKARFPEYDLESYLKYLDTENPLIAVLGNQIASPQFKGEIPPQKPLTERYPYLLPGILGVLVLILGSFVFKLAFQVKNRK